MRPRTTLQPLITLLNQPAEAEGCKTHAEDSRTGAATATATTSSFLKGGPPQMVVETVRAMCGSLHTKQYTDTESRYHLFFLLSAGRIIPATMAPSAVGLLEEELYIY